MSEVTTQDPEVELPQETAEAAEIQPALKLDCRGMNCPLPMLKTEQAIDIIEVGQVLRMIADDPCVKDDMKAFIERTGHEILDKGENGEYFFLIRKV